MKVLVLGGTGTVGSLVARELASRGGVEVSILSRDPQKAKGLPPGVRAIQGDLLDPATVRSAFSGVDGVFLLNAVSATETHEGLMAVNGIRKGGVKRVVYMSIHDLERALYLPHFGSKIPVEIGVKESGAAWTILRPNNFYQNDYWYKDVLLGYGVYPQPIGEVGLSRVDVRDIAEMAAIALTTDGHEGQTYNVVGPKAWTGRTTAEAWSRALEKPITYAGDLEAWERQSLQYLPAWMVFDFGEMYGFFQREGLKASAADVERLTKLLGHPPRAYEAFVDETAKSWSAA